MSAIDRHIDGTCASICVYCLGVEEDEEETDSEDDRFDAEPFDPSNFAPAPEPSEAAQ